MEMNDKKVIMYLVDSKITRNMELIRLYNKHKAEYAECPDPTKKLNDNSLKMRRVRELFDDGFITFDSAVKAIANDSLND